MKIVYCLNSIREAGGIAKVTAVKANALAEVPGNEVFVCVSDHSEDQPYRLSSKVKLVDLNIDYYKDDWKSKWHVLKGIVVKRRKHRKALKEVLNKINPDIVISVGLCEKYFLPEIKGTAKAVREIHSSKNYRNMLADGLLSKLKANVLNIYDYRWAIKKYDRIVVLTNEDQKLHWSDNKKVSVISNPLTFSSDTPFNLTNKTIITLGRLAYEKNHSSLIRAFAIVAKRHPDWTLKIYGEGSLKEILQKQIETMRLTDNVKLMGQTLTPIKVYEESSIFVLSSRFEGFPLVLIEAMECGLPVVSYDCPCGPKDIISDDDDGFLIECGNEESMADKINYLIEHPEKRREMGNAAQIKARNYALDNIIPQWMVLFKNLC